MTQSDLTSFSPADDADDEADAADATDPTDAAAVVAGNGGGRISEVVDVEDAKFPDSTGTVELMVTQVDYTIEGAGREEHPVIHVFGRREDGTHEHVRVLGFEPYFYVPTDSLDTPPEEAYDVIVDSREAGSDGERFESIRGQQLTKIIGRTPRDVGEVRDEFDHYEADILFPNRFLIDKDINSGIEVSERRLDGDTIQVPHTEVVPADVDSDLRVNIFDIEVDDRRGFPEDGEEPIVCLTSYDSFDAEYIAWLYEAPDGDGEIPVELPDYEPYQDDIAVDVRTYDSEAAMLDAFIDYIDDTNPDILTGWNFEDFDAPYFLDRLEGVDAKTDRDLSVDRLSRIDEVWRSGWGGPDIKGRVVFDLLYGYKRTQFTELDSYRLDAVGELELGVGKERYAGDIGDLWEDDPTQLLEYNLRDVELCVEIDRKQGLIDFWDEVRKFVGCKLEDAPTPGDAVDQYVLHKAYGKFALPTKGKQESEDFEGGAVFDPITGVRENISVLDLKCFSSDTDVLTPSGPKSITEIEVGDTVYTLNPETFECEVSSVAETHEYDNKYGELHHLSGNTHDFKITENHRFLASKTRGWDEQTPDDFEFTEYRDLTDSERYAFPQHQPVSGRTPETFDLAADLETGHIAVYCDEDLRWFRNRMPEPVTEQLDLAHGSSSAMGVQQKVGKYLLPMSVYLSHRETVESHADGVFLKYDRGHGELSTRFEMADWLELVGWYVTEGSLDSARGRVTLHQSDADGRATIRALLDRMDIPYSTDDRGFNISNQHLVNWLGAHCGHDAANKQLPTWAFELDGELLRGLLDTLIQGDGSRTASGLEKYWTTSDTLKNDIVDLAVRCGEKPTVSKESDDTWYISIGKRGSFNKSTNATTEPHDGTVHCITAEDNHVILAGRNGHYQWIGQSLYPMCMVTINAGPETKVDDEFDGETYRAPNGTQFRKEPDGIMREMVDELLTEREEKKKLRDQHDPDSSEYAIYDTQQAAVKVIMNSLYGVTGWDRFRLYDKEGAAAVTATGREVIDFTETVASELEYEVAYGDSVTGDRPVVVRDPDRIVRVLPIADLFERATASTADAVVITADGGAVGSASAGKNRRRLDGWEALSLAADGEPEWQPIQQAIRHEVDKPVVNLQHKFGESTTTRDHSYVVDDDGELVEATPSDVDKPLRIPGMPAVDTVETIDVYEVLDGYTREYEDGRSVGSEDAATKTKRVHANDEWVWFGHDHHNELSKSVKVQRYIDIDSEDGASLLRLLAAYITEGSASTIETTESRFGASIAESREEWLDGLQSDYYRLFENTSVSVIASDSSGDRTVEYETTDGAQSITYDDTTHKLQLMNELSAVFFREFAGQTSRGKRIPGFIFNLSADAQDLFVDTLIEGDGSREFPRYTDEYCERHFDFETTSRELAAGLSMLLTQREQKHSLKYRDAKDSYTIRTCDSYRSGRDPVLTDVDHDGYVYDLSVAENDNFVDGVGGIVLHNTDSVMLELDGDVSKSEAIEQSFEIEEYINSRYDDFASNELNATEHRFQIEFEKLYRRFFQAGRKKRYAGHIIWKEGKDVDNIDITGFEYKRSDIAPITKRVQKSVIETIVTGDDMEADREAVRTYLTTVIEEFRNGERSVEEIGIPGGIGKRLDAYETPTAQVRGAQYANLLLGTNFDRGSKPKRLYLKDVHSSFFRRVEDEQGLDPRQDPLYGEFKRDPDVICFEYADQLPEEFEIDLEKMLEKTLKGPISRVIEALDMSWNEIKTGQTQTGLEQYW